MINETLGINRQEILENIDKEILENIDFDQILNRLEFGISKEHFISNPAVKCWYITLAESINL